VQDGHFDLAIKYFEDPYGTKKETFDSNDLEGILSKKNSTDKAVFNSNNDISKNQVLHTEVVHEEKKSEKGTNFRVIQIKRVKEIFGPQISEKIYFLNSELDYTLLS
jgi:hypothetical protein